MITEEKLQAVEDHDGAIDSLIKRVEEYGKTSYELVKLKALDATVEGASTFVPALASLAVMFLFVLILNLALGFWLGDLLGKIYYGFFIVAGFDLLAWIIVRYGLRSSIKRNVSNAVIKKVFK